MHSIKMLFLSALFFVIAGCSIQKQVVGEFYLEQKQYDKGYAHFQKNIQKDNSNASSYYYQGRFLLAKGENKKALSSLKKAVYLDNSNPTYHSWLGVAYSLNKEPEKERKEYLSALLIDKNHLQSLLYLAHNFFDKKEYKKALEYYSRVLKQSPQNQIALYNRAMSFNKLGRKAEERLASKEYLLYYPSGSYARKIVNNLNDLGNFDYRNFIIGLRIVTLKKIDFEPFSSKIDYDSQKSLDVLGKILRKNRTVNLHIVVYLERNGQLAKQRGKSIKKYLLDRFPIINSKRLKLSWFDKSKNIKKVGSQYKLYESIEFISETNK